MTSLVVNGEQINPCCASLKEKYINLEGKRNYLRQAVKIYNEQIDKYQSEICNLKKAHDDEKTRADNEREEKVKELGVRATLENEISALKSEISLMQQKGHSVVQDADEVRLLHARVSEVEIERNRLKEILEKEKSRADLLQKKAAAEKEKASEAWKVVKAEKSRSNEEKNHADMERRKAEGYRNQLEKIEKDAEDAWKKLVLANIKLEEANKKLEAEKQVAIKERRRADSEALKTEEQRKIAETNRKKAMEEKSHADYLSQQLRDTKLKIEELQKNSHAIKVTEVAADGFQPEMGNRESDETKLSGDVLKTENVKQYIEVEPEKAVNPKKLEDLEMVGAEEHRKFVEMYSKKAMEEKKRADQLLQKTELDKQTIEKLQKQIHALETSRHVERPAVIANNLEDREMVEAKEHRKLLEIYSKKVEEEKHRADQLFRHSELDRKTIERLQKEIHALENTRHVERPAVTAKNHDDGEMGGTKEHKKLVETSNKKAMEEKHRADQLFRQSELNKQTIETLKKQIHALEASRHVERPVVLVDKNRKDESKRISFLKKQLKFEKAQVKHAKEVAKLEKGRSALQHQEVCGLKQELIRLSQRLDVLDIYFSNCTEGIDDLTKAGRFAAMEKKSDLQRKLLNVEQSQKCLQKEIVRPTCTDTDVSDCFIECTATLPPVSGVNHVKNVAGSASKLDPPLGGSRKLLQSSAVNSSTDSFPDKQLLGSEGRGTFCVTASAKLGEENSNPLQPIYSKLSGELTKINFNEKDAIVAENSVRGPCNTNVVGRVSWNSRKRKRIFDAVESVEHLYSQVKKLLDALHDTLNRHTEKSLEEKRQLDPDQPCKSHDRSLKKKKASHKQQGVMHRFSEIDEQKKREKLELNGREEADVCRKVSVPANTPTTNTSTICGESCMDRFIGIAKSNQEMVVGFAEMADGNYMKLLELDNVIDEERYQKAIQMPVSPMLPDTGFLSCDAFAMEGEMSNVPLTINEEAKFPNEGKHETVDGSLPACFVVFSDILESSNISRIFCATRACLGQCSLASQTEWVVQEVLLALLCEEDLSPKGKVCVFFSILLHQISTAAIKVSENFFTGESYPCINSFAAHIRLMMSDMETRSIFAQICNLDDLLDLTKDFLLNRKIFVYSGVSAEPLHQYDSRIGILLSGVSIMLSMETASNCQLVAGSIILASICAALGQFGVLCEISYNIFQIREFNSSLMLTILHVFAYLGGNEYLNLNDYNLLMTVIKSIITFFERENFPVVCLPSPHEALLEFPKCALCPFSEGATPLNIVTSMLLDKLSCSLSGTKDPMESHKITADEFSGLEDVLHVPDVNCDASCCLNNLEISFTQSETFSGMTLCHLSDILSLVELVASKMTWSWTCERIVAPLLEMLESCVQETLSVAIVTLLGEIGRLGVDGSGCENSGVQNLQSRLSAFLGICTARESCLPLQTATVYALLGLISFDFEVLTHNMEIQVGAYESAAANLIKNWLSSLSSEQQSLALSLFKSAGVNKNQGA